MKLQLFICLVLGAHWLVAQNQIQGMVVDENEEPIGFCHVHNLTLELGKVSDMKGKFVVLANQGDSIRFSYVGYQPTIISVSNSHIVNFIKITLPKDSVLLPSITIYADKYFKVPIKPQFDPIFIPGVSIPGPQVPIKAGDAYVGSQMGENNMFLAPTVGIYGPITYFSKDEREKRKAEDAYEETRETLSYQKFMANDTLRHHLSRRFNLDSAQYTEIIYRLHENFPGIQRATMKNEIWHWLLSYFEQNAPIVKRNMLMNPRKD